MAPARENDWGAAGEGFECRDWEALRMGEKAERVRRFEHAQLLLGTHETVETHCLLESKPDSQRLKVALVIRARPSDLQPKLGHGPSRDCDCME